MTAAEIIAVDDELLARFAAGGPRPSRPDARAMAVELIAVRAVLCPPAGSEDSTTLHDQLAQIEGELRTLARDMEADERAYTFGWTSTQIADRLSKVLDDVATVTP